MNAEQILDHLQNWLPHIHLTGHPKPLSGGLLNQVWRVPAEPRPVIVKHAPPHVAADPSIALDPNRIHFEADALIALSPDGPLAGVAQPDARAPNPLDLDRDAHVLVMEDIGEAPSLTEAIPNLPSPSQTISALGHFIGRLHRQSLGHPQLAADFRNQAVQETRLAVQYRGVRELLQSAEIPDANALGDQAEALGHRLLQPGRCLVMGDLWPPSIRIVPDGIRLIDWEFAHFGNPAQDLAHLDAHLWMAAHRASDWEMRARIETVRNDFFAAYENAIHDSRDRLLTPEVFRDAAIHFGAEIIVRTIGPFSGPGSPYADLPPDHPNIQAAVSIAAWAIRGADEAVARNRFPQDFSPELFSGGPVA